ncbi:M91 family zinc metallopeptidase [Odoribacter laneus]
MKKSVFFAIAAACIVSTMFLIGSRINSILTSYESGNGFHKIELQNKNPYAIFGSDAVVLMTEAERNSDHVLEIINDSLNDLISRMELDMHSGIVKLFDKEGNLIEERLLDAKEKARWLTSDRFAEKYYSHSPYSYAVGNPVQYIDINGDSIWIAHKGNNYLYENGTLYLTGQEYTGKIRGFLKQTMNALGSIGSTTEGGQMISELSASTNNFTIMRSSNNEFKSSNIVKAYGQQHIAENSATYQMMGANYVSGGSEGTIYWNPKGASLPTTVGMQNEPFTVLGHEMFHGLDANRGTLISGEYNGVNKNEWQAVYRENVMRSQAGLPLRSHYGTAVTPEGVRTRGVGPRMITPGNQPILPSWYQP